MRRAPVGGKSVDGSTSNVAAEKRPRASTSDADNVTTKRSKAAEVEASENTEQTKPQILNIYNETSCYDGLDHKPVENHEKGDVSCQTCGLVLDEMTTVSDVEWAKNKTGVDLPAQLERHGDFSNFAKLMGNHCPETTLDFSNCKPDLVKSYQCKSENEAVHTLRKGYMSIRDLCDKLYITDEKTKDDAFIMLRHCHEKKLFNNETNMARFVPVCVYTACLDSTPLFQWEVIGKSEGDEKKVRETYQQIQKEIFGKERGETKHVEYLKSLQRIVSTLNFKRRHAFKIESEARHIMQTIRDHPREIITCMNDNMLFPAAIYAGTVAHADFKPEELASLKRKLSSMFSIRPGALDSSYEKDILPSVDRLMTRPELADKLRKASPGYSAPKPPLFGGGLTAKRPGRPLYKRK